MKLNIVCRWCWIFLVDYQNPQTMDIISKSYQYVTCGFKFRYRSDERKMKYKNTDVSWRIRVFYIQFAILLVLLALKEGHYVSVKRVCQHLLSNILSTGCKFFLLENGNKLFHKGFKITFTESIWYNIVLDWQGVGTVTVPTSSSAS